MPWDNSQPISQEGEGPHLHIQWLIPRSKSHPLGGRIVNMDNREALAACSFILSCFLSITTKIYCLGFTSLCPNNPYFM
jgi:hypothetical protein